MYFVLQTPSLQHLSGVKVVATLWNQRDSLDQIAESFKLLPADKLRGDEQKWKQVEDQVKSKVSVLPLPETCKMELLHFVKPLGMEIIAWRKYHNLSSSLFNLSDTSLPLQFCWSMRGTVNYATTAQLIVKDERLDVERRYEIACRNCLEDEARELFQFLPNDRVQKYITLRFRRMNRRILIAYFTCTFSGDADQLNKLFRARLLRGKSINQYLFAVVLCRAPRATCEYFLQKLSQQEKVVVYLSLDQLLRTQFPACGLMYCISLMNEEVQQLVFPECISYLLMILLRWPMQSLFAEAAKRGGSYMNDRKRAEVLNEIIIRISHGFKDYDYAQLFKELWRLSPAEHKHFFLNGIDRLENLFATKRKEFIKLVLNQAPAHLLKELIEKRYEKICSVLMDVRVISDAALMECKQTAALNSSNDEEDVEKQLRSEYVSRLVDITMENRTKSRVITTGSLAMPRD